MLGVPRCIDPMCARAYPASLEEHDAKGDKLCEVCRAGFARALGHELGE
jgi:predicted Zn-dependent protease